MTGCWDVRPCAWIALSLSRVVEWRLRVRLAMVVLIVLGHNVRAQALAVSVREPASCGSCTIQLARLVSLGDTAEGLSSWPASVIRDSRGRFIVLQPYGSDGILAFSDRGEPLGNIGRAGAGPGEFRSPVAIALGRADSVLIVDRMNARLSVLDPNWRFVRSAPAPANAFGILQLASHDIVINASVGDRSLVGFPFHQFDAVGNHKKSFGYTDGTIITPENEDQVQKVVALARAGGFWAAELAHKYAITLYDDRGRVVRVIERRAAWCPSNQEPAAAISPKTPPRPEVWGLFEDSKGLLWILVRVADRRWARGLSASGQRNADGQVVYAPTSADQLFDTIVDVIDPQKVSLIASQRFDQALLNVVQPGVVAHVKASSVGGFILEIVRMELVRK